MTPTLRDAQRHADRILDVLKGDTGQVADMVARSWSRCLHELQLDPARPLPPGFVSPHDLESRRARCADAIACARYEMSTLYQQLADADTAVVLCDTDGVIVHMVASPDFAAVAGPMGLRVGGVWSEAAAGTNGMGTCIAAGSPVSIRREDHFYSQFAQLTCSAVPVFDPAGEIAAVLDVTSRSSLAQQHVLVLLGMTARMVENRLIDARFRQAHPVHFHSRPEFVYTLHEGRLAVGDDGRVLAANRSALFQLGLGSVAEIRTRRIEELFETSLEHMLERSASAAHHPVVTYRANAAHRFFAVARRPAGEAAPPPLRKPWAAAAPTAEAPAHAPTFEDPRLAAHLDTACRVIARRTPVLLCGETGSGKEVFARAVHAASPHARGAFVAVNCASLPETLIEAELFGYRAGAFTGAQRVGRRGKVLQADGGTLFLDEIADMPLELQARLLRVLDERQVTPLGSEDAQPVDFQLISASHEHLPARVQQGRFREDLFYRLAGIELTLPPLRERSDRPALIRQALQAEGGSAGTLADGALQLLLAHAWPGNIRQLRHVLRTAVALADGRPLTAALLAPLLGPVTSSAAPAGPAAAAEAPVPDAAARGLGPIQAHERQLLLQLLEQQRWNMTAVARTLGVSRNTLYRKLGRLHIEVTHPH